MSFATLAPFEKKVKKVEFHGQMGEKVESNKQLHMMNVRFRDDYYQMSDSVVSDHDWDDKTLTWPFNRDLLPHRFRVSA